MIKDTQCDLPKEDLSIQLSRVLVAQGKREEAIKVLERASSQVSASSMLRSKLTEELSKLREVPNAGPEVPSVSP